MTSRPRRRSLRDQSSLTFGDIERQPDMLLGTADLVSARIIGSYGSLYRAIRDGKLPQPIRLPSGRLAWRGRDVLRSLGVEPPAPEHGAAA